MGLRDRMYELTQVDEVNEFLERFPHGAIFKAGGCHKTSQGFGYVEQVLSAYDQMHMGFIRVIESRPASNHVAEITDIVHQSPQLILFVEGKPVYDVDNWEITLEAVSAAMEKHYGLPTSTAEGTGEGSDVSKYVELLESFLAEKLSFPDFEQRWLTTFQVDATPRSTKEFNLLNSLFGDVDAALSAGLLQPGGENLALIQEEATLRERAKELLAALT